MFFFYLIIVFTVALQGSEFTNDPATRLSSVLSAAFDHQNLAPVSVDYFDAQGNRCLPEQVPIAQTTLTFAKLLQKHGSGSQSEDVSTYNALFSQLSKINTQAIGKIACEFLPKGEAITEEQRRVWSQVIWASMRQKIENSPESFVRRGFDTNSFSFHERMLSGVLDDIIHDFIHSEKSKKDYQQRKINRDLRKKIKTGQSAGGGASAQADEAIINAERERLLQEEAENDRKEAEKRAKKRQAKLTEEAEKRRQAQQKRQEQSQPSKTQQKKHGQVKLINQAPVSTKDSTQQDLDQASNQSKSNYNQTQELEETYELIHSRVVADRPSVTDYNHRQQAAESAAAQEYNEVTHAILGPPLEEGIDTCYSRSCCCSCGVYNCKHMSNFEISQNRQESQPKSSAELYPCTCGSSCCSYETNRLMRVYHQAARAKQFRLKNQGISGQ